MKVKKIKGQKAEYKKQPQTTMGFCDICNDQTLLYQIEHVWLCGACRKYGDEKPSDSHLGEPDTRFKSTF